MAEEVFGVIAPHPPIMVAEVGGRRAEVTAASTGSMVAVSRLLRSFDPQAVVLVSPHAPLARDSFVIDGSDRLTGDLGSFGAPDVDLAQPGDPALAAAIIAEAEAAAIPVTSRALNPSLQPGVLDHGVLVPLSFLDRDGRYPIVVISLSFLPLPMHRALGTAVRRAVELLGRRVAFIASGDLSHRLTPDAPAGYSPRGRDFDARIVDLISSSDYRSLEDVDPSLVQAAGECGLRSFVALGGYLQGSEAVTRVLAYEGPWGVGYLTAVAASADRIAGLDTPAVGAKGGRAGEAESAPVTLARAAIEGYVRERRIIEPPAPEGAFAERHGAFVSLHIDGRLRGCIGTIAPTRPTLASEIVHNAVQAASRDPRFPPLTAEELLRLDISVDVLQAPEAADIGDLDPARYGVIVSCGSRRGLLLPDLAGVDTVAEQVGIACRKACIGAHETVRLERFCVDRYR
ncbi:MAG: AmmeMemoRadiSam system protein A [Coriobacteriia bacterium]